MVALSLAAAQEPWQAVEQAIRSKDYAAALALSRKALRAEPRNPRVQTLEGMAFAGLGRSREALAVFREALRTAPAYLPALEGAAQLEYAMGDPNCRKTLDKIVTLQPQNETAHAMLGVLAYEAQRCDQTVSHFAKAGEAVAHDRLALWQMGNCLFRLHRAGDAAAVFGKLLPVQDDAAVRFNLALAKLAAKQPGEAREALQPLVDRAVPESDVLSLYAAALEEDGQVAEAVSTLRRATELYPREERHYLDLAAICLDHSSFDLGLEILDVAARNLPDSPRLHSTRGALLVQMAKYEDAQGEFAKAQALAPAATFAAVGRGLALLQSDRPEDSARVLRAQLKKTPNDPDVSHLLAQVLIRQGATPGRPDFTEAILLLQRAVAAKPGLAAAHAALGKLYLKQGEAKKAQAELQVAIRLDPSERTAIYQLLLIYQEEGRTKEVTALKQKLRDALKQSLVEETERERVHLIKAAPDRERVSQ